MLSLISVDLRFGTIDQERRGQSIVTVIPTTFHLGPRCAEQAGGLTRGREGCIKIGVQQHLRLKQRLQSVRKQEILQRQTQLGKATNPKGWQNKV